MNQDLKDRWVAALRSGDYIQGKGALRQPGHSDGDWFCCLGVLCDIVAPELWSDKPYTQAGVESAYEHDFSAGLPSVDFMAALDLDLERIHFLAKQNDNGANFAWIAAYIENVMPVSELVP